MQGKGQRAGVGGHGDKGGTRKRAGSCKGPGVELGRLHEAEELGDRHGEVSGEGREGQL